MKESSKKDEIIYSKNVIEFITVANEYCLFIEKTANYEKEDIIQYFLKVCPLLYLKGILLPTSEDNDFEITERYVTQENWETIFFTLKNKFGKDDSYWTIVNNNADEIAPAKASIAEHLVDIYQDMKDFIMLYQKGTQASKENAVAECRYLFETHWGSRLANAHRALHNIAYTENIRNDDFYESEN